jgi:hypothetical protein
VQKRRGGESDMQGVSDQWVGEQVKASNYAVRDWNGFANPMRRMGPGYRVGVSNTA